MAIQLADEGHQQLVMIKLCAREQIWFLGIDRKLTMAVEEYLLCQVVINTRQQEPFKMKELPNGPQKHLQADFLDCSQARNTYW